MEKQTIVTMVLTEEEKATVKAMRKLMVEYCDSFDACDDCPLQHLDNHLKSASCKGFMELLAIKLLHEGDK